MKDLLSFILQGITTRDDFVVEEVNEDDNVSLKIIAPNEVIGLIIGKNGKTIKAIQNIVKVRARLEGKMVFINVEAKEP